MTVTTVTLVIAGARREVPLRDALASGLRIACTTGPGCCEGIDLADPEDPKCERLEHQDLFVVRAGDCLRELTALKDRKPTDEILVCAHCADQWDEIIGYAPDLLWD